MNYQKRVQLIDNESIFDYKGFLEDSDPEYKEFFFRFLQVENGTQSNNQMFNNFITITTSKVQDDMLEEEIIMTDHIRTAIKRVQEYGNHLKNDTKNSREALKK